MPEQSVPNEPEQVPQPQPQPAEVTPQKTNTLSIVGLVMPLMFPIAVLVLSIQPNITLSLVGSVMSLIVPIVGLVLSIVALFQIKKTNQKGKGLAIAGATISIIMLMLASTFLFFALTDAIKNGEFDQKNGNYGGTQPDKPVIYLYPTSPQEVSVKLKYDGQLTDIYPGFNQPDGWKVLAQPNGELTDLSTFKPYSYLFWEGKSSKPIALPDEGFVVKGGDTAEFLQQKLAYLGLTPKEYNEMIVYWLPKMQHNAYNHVYFATTSYTDTARLEIEPKPDSLLRVFMVFRPLDQPKQVKEQSLQTFERKGFSVIEWGGSELK